MSCLNGGSNMRKIWFCCLAAWTLASPVRADVVPDGYVETCTLQKACAYGQECVSCPSNRFEREPTACSKNLGPLGFAMRCRSGGGTTWEEIWCRAASGAGDASVSLTPPDGGSAGFDDPRFDQRRPIVVCKRPSDDGCALTHAHGKRAPAALVFAGSALLLAAYRRRKRQLP
jgi:hypothetical protein